MNRNSFWYKASCVLFPERCALCGEVITPNARYCETCKDPLFRIQEPRCLYCGSGKDSCVCKRRKNAYDAVVSVFYYTGHVREHFPIFKRRERYGAAETLAEDMAKLVRTQEWETEVITYVPSHSNTLEERGFNPAKLLAEALGKELSLPVAELLTKIYDTEPQKDLPIIARSGNLLGAFDILSLPPYPRSVLLVDDVTTTGGTLDECAKMLKIYGVEEVYAVTACFTPRKPTQNLSEKPLVKTQKL